MSEVQADMEEPQSTGKKGKYRRPKPWDHDGIDHWKIEEFTPDHSSGPFLEESSFVTLFPQYREKYLRQVHSPETKLRLQRNTRELSLKYTLVQVWPTVTKALDAHGISCELNLIEGSMTVKTTRKTFDPFAILKAKELIKLLARSVPVQQATKIMMDDIASDIIKIGNLTRNKERFVKRRQRLIGPNGSTLKAIELLTECYVLVQGNTVSAVGSHKGLKQVRRIVEDCMNNVHPVYNIKILMIKRELSRDDELKSENWDRFLPKFKKKNQKQKKTARKEKKPYTPFPPLPPQSKVDKQLESGEYFLSERGKSKRSVHEKKEAAAQKSARKRQERAKDYIPPPAEKRQKKESVPRDMEDMKNSIRKKVKERAKSSSSSRGANDYLTPKNKAKKKSTNPTE
eukprot:CAMPEP_0113958844 /NCGR_PEP_ID=MMETSP0011_2-20120614/3730_1 /TAXON_ID=101924 /ORGANISM="Rhodosorus marinus" /LENGTH=399 /DNA_ID=CAMNT_0000969921 /DNA_START=131 /DNA_END=1331 /DNA_ORIENTATION=- /assembly_acc=CAM_ASM_000156